MDIAVPFNGWKIIREIGRGSFGRVYEIERDFFGDKMRSAMKVISIPTDQSTLDYLYGSGFDDASISLWCRDRLDDIRNEYSLMEKLKGNTNIVSVEDIEVVGKENGIGYDVFIRMELLTSLQTLLKTTPFTEDDVIKLGKDICRALVVCERFSLIHRDIKPENIMVTDFGDYKLGDFGIARTLEHTTQASVAGTERYMAPEIIHHEKYGRDVDTYSLGLVMYWLLNRRTMPFMTIGEIPTLKIATESQTKRLTGTPLPPPEDGSNKLKSIVLKATSFNREDRYASAADMLADLEALPDTGLDEFGIPKPPVLFSTAAASSKAATNAKAAAGSKAAPDTKASARTYSSAYSSDTTSDGNPGISSDLTRSMFSPAAAGGAGDLPTVAGNMPGAFNADSPTAAGNMPGAFNADSPTVAGGAGDSPTAASSPAADDKTRYEALQAPPGPPPGPQGPPRRLSGKVIGGIAAAVLILIIAIAAIAGRTKAPAIDHIDASYSGEASAGVEINEDSDITVTAFYADGSEEVVSGWTIDGGTLEEGDNDFTITYQENTTHMVIPVSAQDDTPESSGSSGQNAYGDGVLFKDGEYITTSQETIDSITETLIRSFYAEKNSSPREDLNLCDSIESQISDNVTAVIFANSSVGSDTALNKCSKDEIPVGIVLRFVIDGSDLEGTYKANSAEIATFAAAVLAAIERPTDPEIDETQTAELLEAFDQRVAEGGYHFFKITGSDVLLHTSRDLFDDYGYLSVRFD